MLTADDLAAINAGKAAYEKSVATIRSDEHLSPQGKAAALGQLLSNERARRREIAEAAAERTRSRRDELGRSLWRIPEGADASTAINYRDAFDRAESASTPAELAVMARRAADLGDTAMVRATAAVGYREANRHRSSNNEHARAWRSAGRIAEEQLSDDQQEMIAELDQIDTALVDPDRRMVEEMAVSVLSPVEVRHLHDHQLPDAEPAGERMIPIPTKSGPHPFAQDMDSWMRDAADSGPIGH